MRTLAKRSCLTLPILGMSICLVSAAGGKPALAGQSSSPSVVALATSGWNEVTPNGDALCARGAPFAFFVRPGASDRVVIDFMGGGACWNADTCDEGSLTFTDTVDGPRQALSTGQVGGIWNHGNPNNPYQEWTHVIVPYCTGDVHWGSSDVTYKRENGTEFKIYHRGANNADAAVAWVLANYGEANRVVVSGCSAGAYGSIYWTPKVKEAYPKAQVSQFADAGVGVLSPAFMKLSFPLWNVGAHAPAWVTGLDPKKVDYTELSLSDFYVRVGQYYPGLHLAEYTSAHDQIQTFFYELMGGQADGWTGKMLDNLAYARSGAPLFNSYVAAGDAHCSTVTEDFYKISTDGTALRDWVADYIAGGPYRDVSCKDCESR